LVELVVDLGQDSSRFDLGAVIHELSTVFGIVAELLDHSLNLGADVDHLFGLDRARRADGCQQRAAFDRRSAICRRRMAAVEVVPAAEPRGRDGQDQDNGYENSHDKNLSGDSIVFARQPALADTPRATNCSKCCRKRCRSRWRSACSLVRRPPMMASICW